MGYVQKGVFFFTLKSYETINETENHTDNPVKAENPENKKKKKKK